MACFRGTMKILTESSQHSGADTQCLPIEIKPTRRQKQSEPKNQAERLLQISVQHILLPGTIIYILSILFLAFSLSNTLWMGSCNWELWVNVAHVLHTPM